jgi:hypothetical protein
MSQRRTKVSLIPAEKMALLAEKGLNATHVSRNDLLALAHGGLSELYTIKEGIKNPPPPLDQQLIDQVIAAYFPSPAKTKPTSSLSDIVVQLTKNAVKSVTEPFGWQLNSPAFAQRGPEPRSVSLCKKTGKLIVHLEIAKSFGKGASIAIRLTDSSNRERLSFETALFHNDRCIESVHSAKNPVASFSKIAPGDYLLKVSDKKGEIASVTIRLEE